MADTTTIEDTPEDAPVRASGSTPAVEDAHEVAADIVEPIGMDNTGEDVEHEPRRIPRFERLRFNYFDATERRVLQEAHHEITGIMVREFMDAYRIIDEIKHIVRIPLTDEQGETIYDANGEPEWEMTPGGRVIEDYSRLTRKQQEMYLGQITTELFAWEQKAEQMWMDAIMARARFEEHFAIAYDELRGTAGRTTVDDRKAYGTAEAAGDRYQAIYITALSRRGAALVKSMERLSQRLKDVLTAA
jgi:hypothetical protein